MIETLLFSAPASALTFFKFWNVSQLPIGKSVELLFYAKQTMICQYHTLFKPKKKKKNRGPFLSCHLRVFHLTIMQTAKYDNINKAAFQVPTWNLKL